MFTKLLLKSLQALTNTWKAACASAGPSKVVIPGGKYKMGAVKLLGPCTGRIEVQVQGYLQASGSPKIKICRVVELLMAKEKQLGVKMIVSNQNTAINFPL